MAKPGLPTWCFWGYALDSSFIQGEPYPFTIMKIMHGCSACETASCLKWNFYWVQTHMGTPKAHFSSSLISALQMISVFVFCIYLKSPAWCSGWCNLTSFHYYWCHPGDKAWWWIFIILFKIQIQIDLKIFYKHFLNNPKPSSTFFLLRFTLFT